MKDYIELVLGVFALAGIIYRIARIETAIYKAIDDLKDNHVDRLNRIEANLAIHLKEYEGHEEMTLYRINQLNEKTDHKFNRCWSELKQQQGWLQKQGFHPRDEER